MIIAIKELVSTHGLSTLTDDVIMKNWAKINFLKLINYITDNKNELLTVI